MKPLTTTRERDLLAPLEHGYDSAEPALYPELHFRALVPTEALIAVAREQDALCRAALDAEPAVSRVTIERVEARGSAREQNLANSPETMHRVFVRATLRGIESCGQAEHARSTEALRDAYTALLHHAANATPCPCRQAA